MKKILEKIRREIQDRKWIRKIDQRARAFAKRQATLLILADKITTEINVYTHAYMNAIGRNILAKSEFQRAIREIEKIVYKHLTVRGEENREWDKDWNHW